MLITCICAVSHSLDAQTPNPASRLRTGNDSRTGKPTPEPGKPKEFISVQRLVPRLYNGQEWTKEDNAA